ncbi:S41 family peptidase [Taibaiella koreensis]|uniref:S41 family peptidase n=1 Tax=Taibaiella koreensis TaxID=1268548 RepID=UPI0013C32941|nr:S41 family peptidase [Taibaiella koreensis]
MKRTKLIIALCLLAFSKVRAQDCICEDNMVALIKDIESNYVGLDDKVKADNLDLYSKLKKELKAKSKKSKDYNCYLLLKRYIQFFDDPHMSIGIYKSEKADVDLINKMFKDIKVLPINEDELKIYFTSGKLDNVEGIWENPSLKYRVAIFKDKEKNGSFTGVTFGSDGIYWKNHQLKMEITKKEGLYTVGYFRNDHLPEYRSLRFELGNMIIAGFGTWKRILPSNNVSDIINQPVRFSRISDSTCLLSISNFLVGNKSAIDSVVGANMGTISKSKYFLIDLRNNGGGHTVSADTLLPIISSGPIRRDGMYVKASPDNIKMYEKVMLTPGFSEEEKTYFLGLIEKMKKNVGKLIKTSEPDTISIGSDYPYPQKVGILINDGTMSAAEMFLIWARQSNKVTIFGTHSRGALDYAEIGDVRELPCPYLKYTCPMGTTEHKFYPFIDNVGIKPDIEIGEEIGDWPSYMIEYYASHQ